MQWTSPPQNNATFCVIFSGFSEITIIIIGEERKCVRLETRAANLSGWTTPGRKRVGVAAMLIQPSLMLLLAVWSQEKEIDKMGLITWNQKWITSRIKPRNLFWADRAQDYSRTRRGGLCACNTDAWRSHSQRWRILFPRSLTFGVTNHIIITSTFCVY